jgi:hypothetical protein
VSHSLFPWAGENGGPAHGLRPEEDDTMFAKKLLGPWRGRAAGATVVVGEENHDELVKDSLVAPTATVKNLIKEWEAPDGVTYPVDTKVELDRETADELGRVL